jgi:3-oxoacyl-[acyl-carrier protein] reductase
MDLELQDKVAIVGGASKGLGRACAEVLAQEGVKVAMCSRTKADLEQAAQEIRDTTDAEVLVFAGDLDKYDTIRNLIATTVERFGRLDIMVNNSGGPPLARAYNATEEQWETAVQRCLI